MLDCQILRFGKQTNQWPSDQLHIDCAVAIGSKRHFLAHFHRLWYKV